MLISLAYSYVFSNRYVCLCKPINLPLIFVVIVSYYTPKKRDWGTDLCHFKTQSANCIPTYTNIYYYPRQFNR